MTQAKKKGLFAFLLALLASAIVSGALLLSPATANAATGESEGNVITVDSGKIADLQTALVQAQPGDTVRLTQNITLDLTAYDPDLMGDEDINGHMVIGSKAELGDYGVNNGVILDLAGHTLAINTNSYYTCLLIQGVDFTVTDSVGGGRLAGTSNGVFATADASSEITLENVTVEYTYGTEGYFAGRTSDEAAIVTDGALTLDKVDFALAGVSNTATTSSGEAVEGAVESVAKVGDTYYTDVKTAIESATDGQTVELTDNAAISEVVFVYAANVTLDLGEYTLTIPENFQDKLYDDQGEEKGAGVAIRVYGSLTLVGGENGRIDAAEAPETTNPFAAQNGGAITVNSGTIEVDTNSEACIYAFQGGFVTINGGTLINRATGDYTWGGEEVLVVNAASNATTPANTMVQVNGGTFIGRNPAFGDDAIGGTFITEEVKTVTYTLDGQTYIMVYDAETEPSLPEGADPIGGDYFEGETLVNEVNSAAALSSVLDNVAEEAYIRLGASFKADVVIPEGKTVTLDLNGKTLTNVNGHTILNYGTLIITDTLGGGTVDNVTHARAAVYNEYGGDVIILGGTFRRSAEASTSYTNNGGNSYYVIANEGDMVIGSADEDCDIIVYTGDSYEASMYTHMYSALVNTLTYDRSQESHLTIYDGEFYGGNIAIKGDTWSTLAIRGGTISAGNQAVQTWEETEISGGEFNGRVIGWADENGNSATLEITDGTFNGTIETLLFANDGNTYNTDEIETSVSGGNFGFVLPEEYLGEGASLYTDGDGGYAVAPANEAPVGMEKVAVLMDGEGYSTIAEAIAAAQGDEIELSLYDDLVENVVIPAGKTVVLDLAGKTISAEKDNTIENKGTLTINGEGSIVADGMRTALRNRSGATLTVNGGTISSDNGTALNSAGTLIVNGGTFTTDGGGQAATLTGTTVINNGEFITNTPATSTASNAITAMVGGLTIKGGTFEAGKQAVAASNGATVIIEDGDFSVRSYANGNILYADNAVLTVSGGTFKAPNSEEVETVNVTASGSAQISGGEFSNMPKAAYFEDGFVASWNEERKAYVTVKGEFVASIGAYSYATLQEAIDAATDGATVTLLVDIGEETDWQSSDGSSSLQFYEPDGKSVTIDFGGHTVYSGASTYLAAFAGTLTFTNGSLYVYGTGIQVTAYLPTVLSKVVLTDTFSIDSYNQSAVFITTNNNTSYDNLVAELETSADLTSWNTFNNTSQECWATIQGNGTQHGTKITINGGSVVNKKDVAIFHPQYGELAVNGGEIYGETTGIEMRAGLLTVNDGKITGNGDPFTSSPNGNGSTTVGAAVAVSQHSTNLTLNATINGGELNGVRALYEEDMQNDSTEGISLNVNGGTFNGAVESKNVKGFITGGRFAELPAEDAFAEGLAGELYDGYYMVVNAEDVNAAASIADRLSAQSDLRAYLASFGLTITDMQLVAESDELAADIVAAYDEIFAASTKEGVAEALAAAMDAVDAYKLGLDIEKAAALTELTEYAMGAQGEDLAIVVVPTYAISAINTAVTADEIETYVSLAKAEMDDIRAQRAEAEQQYQAVNDRFDAIMQALGITGSAEEGYTSEVLDKLNGVIEALGITEADGAWSTDLLDGITRDLETANENIAAMQDLLGTAADEATAQTIIGMIKATQNSVAAAETNIKNAISTLSSDIQTKYDALVQAVGELPTDVAGALDGRLAALEGTVSRLDTTVGNLGTDIGKLETAVAGLTTAQNALAQAINGYKTAVDGILTDMSGKFEEISAKLDNLPTNDELAQALTNALSGVTEQLTAIKAEVDKIDGMDDTIIGSVSDKIDAAFASFTQTFNTAMSGINTKLDDLGSAVAALPDDADITALKTAIAAAQTAAETAGNKVDTLGTTLGGRLDSVDTTLEGIDGTIAGLTTAQNALAQAINGYKTAVNSALAGIEQNIAGVKADIKNLADTAAADKLELLGKLNALQTSADKLEQAIASLDGDSSADLSAISAELAALQTSLGDVADVVDEVALGNTNSASSFAGIYVYLSAILVLAAVILIVLAVKKRR